MSVTQGTSLNQGSEPRVTGRVAEHQGAGGAHQWARFSFAPQKSRRGQVASVAFTNEGPEDQQAVMSHGLWVP